MKTKNRVYSKPEEPAVIVSKGRSNEISNREAATIELTLVKVNVRRILVPIDFSSTSKKALKTALAFAEQFGGKISLIHVTQPYAFPAEEGFVTANLTLVMKTNETLLRTLALERIPSRLLDRTIVCIGQPWVEITEAARKADLIIMTTHGYTGFKHFCIGSTTEKVVQHAPCPVLTVHEKEHSLA